VLIAIPLNEVTVMKTPKTNGLIPTSIVPNMEKNGMTKAEERPTSRLQPRSTMNVRWRRMVRAGVMRRRMGTRMASPSSILRRELATLHRAYAHFF
jgi:hypothetical protein